MTMTDGEYHYLIQMADHMEAVEYYNTGVACYENGWIDDLGLITPKGRKAMTTYEQSPST